LFSIFPVFSTLAKAIKKEKKIEGYTL
jgi:hypothetical protein